MADISKTRRLTPKQAGQINGSKCKRKTEKGVFLIWVNCPFNPLKAASKLLEVSMLSCVGQLCPHPHPRSHTQAGTKRPTSVWPYQCHRFVRRPFRVHEVSLATLRSIARPTVQQPAPAAATQSCEIKLIRLHTLSDLYL